MKRSSKRVCGWAAGDNPLMRRYHDKEWGVPVHDDRRLFEFLTLEGAQAGLSWRTILGKRENYREAFAGFDPVRVARFDSRRRTSLMNNPGIVRVGAFLNNGGTINGNAPVIVGVQSLRISGIELIKEIRARSRSEKLEQDIRDMKSKAAMLQTKPGAGAASTDDLAPPVSDLPPAPPKP